VRFCRTRAGSSCCRTSCRAFSATSSERGTIAKPVPAATQAIIAW
jgi:hypothetical protein